jgi:ABC-type Mn2+/Zn2+ transport system permease subunit
MSGLSTLLALYAWVLPAGILLAVALSEIGAHLATRERSIQTLCLSQGALLGVLLGLGLTKTVIHADPESHTWPLLFSTLTSMTTGYLTSKLSERKEGSKNTLFLAIFATLLAAGFFVSVIFPELESHMSSIYFGDLATLTNFDAQLTIIISSGALLFLMVFMDRFTDQSFEIAVFGRRTALTRSLTFFDLLSVGMVCYSVQFVGLLFTLSMLFLPTTLGTFFRRTGVRAHRFFIVFTTAFGCGLGFFLSLLGNRIPTVPMIVASNLLIGCALIILVPKRGP